VKFRGCPSIVVAVLAVTASTAGGPGTGAAPSTDTAETVVVRRHHWPILIRVQPGVQLPDSYCSGLGPDEIEVRLNGEPLTVTAVGPRPLPRIHALLIDTSNSMQPRLAQAKRAASEYIRALPPEDAVLVASFNESMILGTPATRDRRAALAAVERLDTGFKTALWQALYYLLLHLEGSPGEKVVLLVTDGEDSSSRKGQRFEQVLELASTTPNLSVFTVGLDLPSVVRVGTATARGKLGMLSRRTGGMFFELDPDRLFQLEHLFRRVRERLDETLYVSYIPPEEGDEPGQVDKLRIRARTDLPCRVVPLGAMDRLENRRLGASADLEIDAIDPADPPSVGIVDECLLCDGDPRLTHRLSLFDPVTGVGSEAALYLTESREVLLGRAVDCAIEGGPLYDSRAFWETGKLRIDWDGKPVFEERDIEIVTPPVASLRARLTGPEELLRYMLELEACAPLPTPDTLHVRAPFLVHGQTFLELRELIGRALFGAYDDYREWAMAKVERGVRAELDALRSRLPAELQLSPEQLEAVGAVLLERASAPQEGRPHVHLVEWLGDVPVQAAMLSLELELARPLLAGDPESGASLPAETVVASWPRLQQWFPPATSARILTPLIPAYDPERDRIGFYRFLLPSPRYLGGRPDLLPSRPLGLESVRWMMSDRRVSELVEGRVALASLAYGQAKRKEIARVECFVPSSDPVRQWQRVELGLTVDDGDGWLSLSAYWPRDTPEAVAGPTCMRVDEERQGPAGVEELAKRLAEALAAAGDRLQAKERPGDPG
jgi:hypothetical protein